MGRIRKRKLAPRKLQTYPKGESQQDMPNDKDINLADIHALLGEIKHSDCRLDPQTNEYGSKTYNEKQQAQIQTAILNRHPDSG